MPRLSRPYIPLSVRVQVAERQGHEKFGDGGWPYIICDAPVSPLEERLQWLLKLLFYDDAKAELHHRPALLNRMKRTMRDGRVVYSPDANDPSHLVYLPKDEHDVETRVRGVGAQRSDLGQARYNKKVAKNRAKPFRRAAQAVSRKRRATSSGFQVNVPMRPITSRREKSEAAAFFKAVKKIANPAKILISRWPPKGARKIGRKR